MILIDKPIPEDCDYCFCNDDGDKCGLLNESFPLYFSGRLPNCPLREMEKADDPISRQAAIDAIRTKYCSSDFMDDGVIDAFAEIIQDLPSAQPEIIRCKDCAKRECCRTSTIWAVAPGDNWYCADAERRTDG